MNSLQQGKNQNKTAVIFELGKRRKDGCSGLRNVYQHKYMAVIHKDFFFLLRCSIRPYE